jgi:hypothetical protein
VIIDSVDFGRVRLLTPTNGTITISNMNTEEAELLSLTVVDPANPHFTFTTPATPQKLAPGATVKIPVVFTPQTRGALSATVRAVIKGKESSPLVGQAKGVGFLPAIAATGYTFAPWTVNTQSPDANGKVVIRNTDADNAHGLAFCLHSQSCCSLVLHLLNYRSRSRLPQSAITP